MIETTAPTASYGTISADGCRSWSLAAPLAAAMSGELPSPSSFFFGSAGLECFADDGDENSVAQASARSATLAQLAAIVLDS